MKKIVLTFGLISGLAISAFMVTSMAVSESCGGTGSMLLGYTAMIIAFAFIFVAVKNYRDKHNGGTVTFGKAFLIGLYISLIASTLYVIAWAIEYNFFMPDFMDRYGAHMVEQAKADGASAAEIAKQLAQVDQWKEDYKNPALFALWTYSEILPVGIIVSLIAALILKRKTPKVDTLAAV